MRGFMIRVQRVRELVRAAGSAVIAYSGGVDSSLLARIAKDELGDRILLVTAESETYTREERENAEAFAGELGVEHIVAHTREMEDPRFLENGPGKCYYCKSIRYADLEQLRVERGFSVLMDGTNADDAGDFRPGARATAKFKVRQPLKEAGMTKSEVRAAAKALGIPTWNHPSQACLASRIQYGIPITVELLGRIAEAEEQVYEIIGTRELRVRHHGSLARIEAPKNCIESLAAHDVRKGLVEALKKLGWSHVALDLEGYRSGSMNEPLAVGEKETGKS